MPGRSIRSKLPLVSIFAIATAIAQPEAALAAESQAAHRPADAATASAEHRPSAATELVVRSLSLLGVNYKWGGNSPDKGLDCSGLVRLVYEETLGKVLPRRSIEMSREGEAVGRHELKPGDLVFFNTLRRAFSHVGIYIGDNQFVHAPSRGKQVRVESLDSGYWSQRFNGARRLLSANDHAPPAAFERPHQSFAVDHRLDIGGL